MIALLLLACRTPDPVVVVDDTDDTQVQLDGDPYDLDHLVRVEIEMDPADWDALRAQTNTFTGTLAKTDCQAEPFERPFTWFEASVTVDGQEFERVEVRKKGFLGSMSETKPSLKLDLGEFDSDATYYGERRLTLNNAIQDESYVRQCLSYAWFDDAGIPAPRCSMAHVTLNGQELGIYVNIEPIKGPLVAQHFDDTSGNLYEGTLSDFREGWTGTLEKKNNESEDDWTDIDALVAALQVPDDELLDALDAVLDVDAFLTFWAAEVLIEHGDGYASNTNNFYLYADPADQGRFRFLPWGTDGVLYGAWDEGGGDATEVVYANGLLSRRLYDHPQGREMYIARLQELLEVWDEDAAADRVARMAAVIEPELSQDELRRVQAAQGQAMAAVNRRRGRIEAVLDQGAPDWPFELRDDFCFEPNGAIDLTFSTTWNTLNDDFWNTGASSLYLDWDGNSGFNVDGGALIGRSDGMAVMYWPVSLTATTALLLYAVVPPERVAPGDVELDLIESYGGYMYFDSATMTEFQWVSYAIGTLTFDDGATTNGAPVTGSFDGAFLTW
jgi:hypothetical protein